MTAYVGIDLHRRRSLAVCLDDEGDRLWWRRFDNSPQMLVGVVSEAGSDAVVVMEATWGRYWAVDILADEGVSPTFCSASNRSPAGCRSRGRAASTSCHCAAAKATRSSRSATASRADPGAPATGGYTTSWQ
jgi:hypothetical protein